MALKPPTRAERLERKARQKMERANRTERRKKLDRIHVAITVVVSIATATLLIWFSAMWGSMFIAKQAYDAGKYERSAHAYDFYLKVTPDSFDSPWRAYLGKGTALLQAGDVDGGAAALYEALLDVPREPFTANFDPAVHERTKECRVRVNYATALAKQGEAAAAEAQWDEAAEYYHKGANVANFCADFYEDQAAQEEALRALYEDATAQSGRITEEDGEN